ncbi:hypothetical protein HYALB_00013663 [Hymenoscyphus albidus]|uniref:Uncharacterized protein n=1 Tax=Hymenoscyphus albidus TaxID=595503 RepID=A0A9N9LV39_9HELO|nr:hypothetical protein HYALB_00013663 [Hymenoscyphus albidus]
MAQMEIVLHDAFEQVQGYEGFEVNRYWERLKQEILLKVVNLNFESRLHLFQASTAAYGDFTSAELP